MVTGAAAFAHIRAAFGREWFLVEARRSGIVAVGGARMSMRLFFLLLTFGGAIYLFMHEHGDRRFAIGALVASSLGLLLQLNMIALRVQYARTIIWTAIAICAGIIWTREGSKTGSTIAATMAFVSTLCVALSLRLLR
jgi:hypothetical protein